MNEISADCYHVRWSPYEIHYRGVFGRLLQAQQFLDVTLVCYDGKKGKFEEDPTVLATDPFKGVKVLDEIHQGQLFPVDDIPEHKSIKAHRVRLES